VEHFELALRDGSRVDVRPITAADRLLIAEGFDRLSAESRYRRFATAKPDLTPSELSWLTDVDHHDHEALVAVDPDTGDAVGVARYIRLADDPMVADAAVTVADDWQGLGLGTSLLEAIADRARKANVRRFSAQVQADNPAAVAMLEHLGESVSERDGSQLMLLIDLPARGAGAQLQDLLRAAAAGSLAMVGAILQQSSGGERVVAGPERPPAPIRKPQTIVVGTDGSATANEAVRVAHELSRRLGCTLHLVSAYSSWTPPLASETRGFMPAELSQLSWVLTTKEEAETVLRAAAARVSAPAVHAHAGDPADGLIAVAEGEDADLIVVGGKPMPGATRWLLGSVATRVARRAPCNVLIVNTTDAVR
jgi:nucleotide-binding universal stress UspA family protein